MLQQTEGAKTKHFVSSSYFIVLLLCKWVLAFASFGSGAHEKNGPNNKSFSLRNWKLSWSARIQGEANIIIFYSSSLSLSWYQNATQTWNWSTIRRSSNDSVRNTLGENEIMKNRWRKFNNKVHNTNTRTETHCTHFVLVVCYAS